MPKGRGNPGPRRCLPGEGSKCFWRCCLLVPFTVLFSMVLITSIVQLSSSSKVLEKESAVLEITEDNDDIHTTTVVALIGGIALLTAVVFSMCLMIVICARCGEEERYLECRGVLLGVLLLMMCIFLLAGLGLSFSTSGYELLHFRNKTDFQEKFKKGALQSLRDYINNTHQVWDSYQKEYKCCGVKSWRDYRKVFFKNEVPASCCNPSTINETQCQQVRMDVQTSDVYTDQYIFSKDCSTVVYDMIGELLQLMYWSSTSSGIAAGTCVLVLCVALIAVCIRTKLKDSDYRQWFPNYDEI